MQSVPRYSPRLTGQRTRADAQANELATRSTMHSQSRRGLARSGTRRARANEPKGLAKGLFEGTLRREFRRDF